MFRSEVRGAVFTALSCVGFIASAPANAADLEVAADAEAYDEQSGSQTVVVTGTRSELQVESPKATQPLLDTPQTITVISDQVIRKQNLLTLRDALATVPGITFGAGEGGGGYGDSINLRGYSANNDITQDGVRDSAQYSRTDPFNLQQIEIYNGANSAFNGSGSVGGTINLVSKTPRPDGLTIVQAGIGTDRYFRGAVDTNHRLSDLAAVRLNAMYHRNDVPGRDFEHAQRWGVAPSIALGVDGPTRFTLSYLHQEDRNTPVYGVPFYRSQINDGPLEEADDSDYFGYRNLDVQDVKVDRLTATLSHSFSEGVSVRSLTRLQRVDQYSQTSAPQGTFCLATTGLQPVADNATDARGLPCPAGLAPGFWQPSGPRGLVRDQRNDLVHSQADLRVVSGKTGGLRNTLVAGASLSWEDYSIETASLPRNPNGSAVAALPIESISNPSGFYAGPINYTATARSRSDTNNRALYVFDTLEIGETIEVNAGLRFEKNVADFRNLALAAYPPGTTPLTALQLAPQRNEETLFSWRAGLVFKPAETVSLYASLANARTPSSATVRLGCGPVSATGAADPCATAPESARNYEIGAKADLFGRRLQVTAALFRNERSNFRTPSNDPSQPAALQVLDGRSRVHGLALGASGNITPVWTIFANYTYLEAKVRQSVSDFCLANPSPACANSAALPDPQAGDQLIQTPKHSGGLFTTYRLPFKLEIGYGLTYQGAFALNQRNLLNRTQYRSNDYLVHRLFLSYPIRQGLTAQLNIQNITNTRYFTGIRNNVNAASGRITGGWASPGEGRSAVASLFYSF